MRRHPGANRGDPLQLGAKACALHIRPAIGVIERDRPREHARSQHRRREPRALFVGPVGDNDRMPGLDPEIVERAHDLQGAQDPENPVIFPARGLGVEMAAYIDRKGVRVFAGTRHEHRAHLVHAHAQARVLAPFLKQRAPGGVVISQGLTVATTRHAGADLGHLHQAVPKARGINAEVLSGCRHRSFSLSAAGRFMPSCDESFSDRMVRFREPCSDHSVNGKSGGRADG